MTRAALLFALVSSVVLVGGCRLVFDGTQVACETDGDCEDLCEEGLCQPREALGPWGCAGRVDYAESGRGEITLTLQAGIGGVVAEGGTVRVCAIGEPCVPPLGGASRFTEGTAVLPAPRGRPFFADYSLAGHHRTLMVESRGREEGMITRTSFLFRVAPEALASLDTDWMRELSRDPRTGQVLVLPSNCLGQGVFDEALGGLTVEVTGAETVAYLADSSVQPDLSITTSSPNGWAFGVNVQPGTQTIRIWNEGVLVGFAEVPVIGGAVTVAHTYPVAAGEG